jgi:LysM repeat protein
MSGIAGAFSAAVSAEDGVYHTILWGDTLSSIAYKYDVTIQDIMTANKLTNPHLIYAGQKLLIPIEVGEYVEYIVVAGDTLLAIASRYGVYYWDIVLRNDIANPNLIYIGQKLIIPSAGAEAAATLEETEAVAETPAAEAEDTEEAESTATPAPAETPAAPADDVVEAAIVITSPLPDAEVSSPVTVTGFGAGFENTLAVDILDQTGVAIGQGYVTVDAPEFGRGPFTGTIEFTAPDEAQIGRIQVYSISPRDGAIEQLTSVTVTLKP